MDPTSTTEEEEEEGEGEETKPLTDGNNVIFTSSSASSRVSDLCTARSLENGVYKSTTIAEDKHCSARPQILASVSVAAVHIVLGFGLGFSAILIPQLEAEDSEIKVTKTHTSWIASSVVLTVPIGALLAGIAMEYFGRLNTIKIAAIPCAVGWIMLATGQNFAVLLIARLLIGTSSGLGTSPSIVYITEVAKPELRGSLISTCPTFTSLGMVLGYVEGAFLPWRTVAWTSLLYLAVPLVLLILFVPESPVWLVTKGRVKDAEKSMRWLMDDKSSLPIDQLDAMVRSQNVRDVANKSFLTRLSGLCRPTGYKPLAILAGLFFFQQFSGIYITLFFAVTFFQDIGSGVDPFVASIMVGVTRLVMSLFTTGVMKRFGKRVLFMFSCIGMAITITVSGFFTQYILNGGDHYTWMPVVCVLLYVCTSMIGLLSIPWTMTAELFPTEIRGIAHGITISVAHFFMFIAVQSYRDLSDIFGGAHAVQWFFAAMSLAGFVFVVLFVPETHKKTLSEIEEYFNENTIYILRKKKSRAVPNENGTVNELKNIS